MDDSRLSQLKFSAGRLDPEFHYDTFQYKLLLSALEDEVTFDWLTNDKGASCVMKGMPGSHRTICLGKGKQKEAKFEVTSEDGYHTSTYHVKVERFTGDNSKLGLLQISDGETQLTLSPDFNADKPDIPCSCSVAWNKSLVRIKAAPSDWCATITISDSHEDPAFPEQVWKKTLDGAITKFSVTVTSQSKSCSSSYQVVVFKERSRVAILPALKTLSMEMLHSTICTFCCNLLHSPIMPSSQKNKRQCSSSRGGSDDASGAHSLFCQSCIDSITMGSNFHPITGEAMEGNWKLEVAETQKTVQTVNVKCIFSQCNFSCSFESMTSHIMTCSHSKLEFPFLTSNQVPSEKTVPCEGCGKHVSKEEKDDHDSYWCYGNQHFNVESFHPAQSIRGWEVRLIEPNDLEHLQPAQIISQANSILNNYLQSLPETSGDALTDEPAKLLHDAARLLASAINKHPKIYKLHFRLAQVLEEWNFVNETISYHGNKADDKSFDSLQSSADSAKEEEVRAICCRHGVKDTDSLTKKLKALDAEYHQLLEWGKLARADYLAFLYSWKSKKSAQETNASNFSSENMENPLRQAHNKYMDAVHLEQNNFELFLSAGKSDLLVGDFGAADKNFALSASIRPSSVESRFFMGLTIALLKKKERYEQALVYLMQGYNALQTQRLALVTDSIRSNFKGVQLQCEKKWQTHDVNIVRGLCYLCKLLVRFQRPESSSITQSCIFLMQNGLSKIQRKNSNIYHRITWNIYKTQYLFIKSLDIEPSASTSLADLGHQSNRIMQDTEKEEEKSERKRVTNHLCSNLASLIHNSNLRKDFKISHLLEKVCKESVINSPNSSKWMYLLGFAQLGKFEIQENETNLNLANSSFEASIDLESKEFDDEIVHPKLKGQEWFSKLTSKTSESKSGETDKNNNQPSSQNNLLESSSISSKPTQGATPVTIKNSIETTKTSTQGTNAQRNTSNPQVMVPRRRISQPNLPKTNKFKTAVTKHTRLGTANKYNSSGGHVACADNRRASVATINVSSKVPSGPQQKLARQMSEPLGKNDSPSVVLPEIVKRPKKPTFNRVSYMPRLGLARVMSHLSRLDEARKFYEEVFCMAPMLHEAYIEAGAIIAKKDPMGAVEIYCRYPFHKSNSGFEDAYLHGEIVHLITKWSEQPGYDPRLEFHMSEWGKISGINILEKYMDILIDGHFMDLVMKIYANVSGKSQHDRDMIRFYKLKGWM